MVKVICDIFPGFTKTEATILEFENSSENRFALFIPMIYIFEGFHKPEDAILNPKNHIDFFKKIHIPEVSVGLCSFPDSVNRHFETWGRIGNRFPAPKICRFRGIWQLFHITKVAISFWRRASIYGLWRSSTTVAFGKFMRVGCMGVWFSQILLQINSNASYVMLTVENYYFFKVT